MSRGDFYAAVFALALANAVSAAAVQSVEQFGWLGAVFALFNTSAVVWLASAAGIVLARRDAGAIEARDGLLAAAVAAVALLPFPTASGVMLAVWALRAVAVGTPGSALRRAGLIFLAITGALVWGKLVMTVLSQPVLVLDSWLTSVLPGVHRDGNVLWRDDSTVRAVVSTGCSSLHGISIALVCWAAVTQYFAVPLTRRSIGLLGAAVLATVAINVVRIGGILVSPEWMIILHDSWGATASMWLTLTLVAACSFLTIRHAPARV